MYHMYLKYRRILALSTAPFRQVAASASEPSEPSESSSEFNQSVAREFVAHVDRSETSLAFAFSGRSMGKPRACEMLSENNPTF